MLAFFWIPFSYSSNVNGHVKNGNRRNSDEFRDERFRVLSMSNVFTSFEPGNSVNSNAADESGASGSFSSYILIRSPDRCENLAIDR